MTDAVPGVALVSVIGTLLLVSTGLVTTGTRYALAASPPLTTSSTSSTSAACPRAWLLVEVLMDAAKHLARRADSLLCRRPSSWPRSQRLVWLNRVRLTASNTGRWDARRSRQVFRQHAQDSEALLLPELRRRLDPGEREQLSRRLLERLGQLESRPWRRGW